VSTNPSPVPATPRHDEPPRPRGAPRGRSREPVPDWAKAAGLAVLLAVITLLLLTPGAAALAAACVLAGAAAVAVPLALPRRAGGGALEGLHSSASRGADDLSRRWRRVHHAVRRTARSAQHGLGERGETVPAVALIIVSVVTWVAIALAVLGR
jgi:type VI protein secretion system component VasF